MRNPNQVQAEHKVATNGDNITNVFGTLTRREQDKLSGQLCRLVPEFADIDVVPQGMGQHSLRFQDAWKEDLWYSTNEVSDGTMLLLAYLLLQYQNPPVEILAIEEPERGLHPYLLEQLVMFLRKLTQDSVGKRPVQVVLATHSAELLEFLKPEEVRFLSRNTEDGSVTVSEAPTEEPAWTRAFDEYKQSMSSIWLSGGLGGVPGTVL